MDNHIMALKCFMDGLGVRDVEFPPELTDAEINLIVEMAVCAAGQIDGGGKEGFKAIFTKLLERCKEEIGDEAAVQVIAEL
ncbi:MAG: hypothetical protein D6B28_09705 [Gammaproteobacteria bacterium]|nr:MAG: hypothetical protein D6B28_09705 [Gammaproteobacteria bacterium]